MRISGRKLSVFLALLLLTSTFFVVTTLLPERASAATLFVGGAGPENYTEIKRAIIFANPGDTIYVYSGTYYENVDVYKTLTLLGQDKDTTIINGMASGDVLYVTADWVNVSGFTLTNSGDVEGNAGIEIQGSRHCHIANSNVSGNSVGVNLHHAESAAVTGNSVSNNTDGILLRHGNGNSIADNVFSLNTNGSIGVVGSRNNTIVGNEIGEQRYGMYLWRSDRNILANNTFTHHWVGVYIVESANNTVTGNAFETRSDGIFLADSRDTLLADNTFTAAPVYDMGQAVLSWSRNITVTGNVFGSGGIVLLGDELETLNSHTITPTNVLRGNPIRYYVDCADIVLDGIPVGQLIIVNCTNFRVSNINVNNATVGIETAFVEGGIIERSAAYDNRWGVFLYYNSSNVTISDSTVSNNRFEGIMIQHSKDNLILNSTAMHNGHGISARFSENITVAGNKVGNNFEGIFASYLNNSLVENNAVHGGFAIWDSSNTTVAENNVLHNNSVFEIRLKSCRDAEVVNNTASAIVLTDSIHNLVANNTPSNNSMRIGLFGSSENIIIGNRADSNAGHGIYLRSSHNNTISGNSARLNNVSGIHLKDSRSNTIIGNNLSENSRLVSEDWYRGRGIHLESADHNTVIGNSIWRNGDYGILLEESRGNRLSDNSMVGDGLGIFGVGSYGHWNTHSIDTSNTLNGRPVQYWKNKTGGRVPSGAGQVILANCTNVYVEDQNLSDGAVGITLGYSSDNTLVNNSASSNRVAGLLLVVSDDNTITRNVFSGNRYGAIVYISEDNRIYHNHFLNNSIQAFDGGHYRNLWDNGYPSGGNYWSDYAGVDNMWGSGQNLTGSDGIGDIPYFIDTDVLDAYPLMTPIKKPMRPPTTSDAVLSGKGRENVTITWLPSPDDGGGHQSIVGYGIWRSTTYDDDASGYVLVATLTNQTTSFTDGYVGEGDPRDYFYVICAIDSDNHTICAENQAGKFTRSLAQGPNLRSNPLVQSNGSLDHVLQTVSYDNAWHYDPLDGEWKWHMRSKGYGRGPGGVNHTIGLWINVTEDSNLTVAGLVPAQTTIHLFKGWNLIGYPSFNISYTVGDLKAELPVERVEGFDPTAPPHFLRVLQDADVLLAGEGYWVKVSADATWVVRNG